MAHSTTVPAPRRASMDRQKLAELTSSTGALIVGIGIGVYLAAPLGGLALWFVLVGVALHGWGMFDRHRELVAATETPPLWWRALYALCWVGLAALLVYALVYSK
ncbi:MAG: hypothetical protein K8M05_03690 [Deltaproteobacteria bacterium]|nr:hypothetical protein [Kofleriaceae bacterium]